MAQDLINSIVDRPVVQKQIADTTTDLELLQKQLVDTSNAALSFNAILGKSSTIPELEKNANRAAQEYQKLQQNITQTQIKTIQLQKAESQLEITNIRLANSQEKQAQTLQKQLSPYQKLSKELDIQRLKAKDLAIQYGESSPQFLKAGENVGVLDKQLKAVDAAVGQNQRNVGNYASAFGKAFGYIRQAAYILPGIGIAGIFNLLGEGAIYATEKLGLFSEKTSALKEKLSAFNDVNKDAAKQAGEEATNLRILYAAATDVNNGMDRRIRATRELKQEFPDTFKNISTETILNGQAKKQYDELSEAILKNAKAKAVANKLSEIEAQFIDVGIERNKIAIAQLNTRNKETVEIYNRVKGALEFQNKQLGLPAPTEDLVNRAVAKQLASQTDQVVERSNKIATAQIKDLDNKEKILKGTKDFLIKYAGGVNEIADALSKGETPGTAKSNPQEIYNERLRQQKLIEDGILNSESSSFQERLKAVDNFEKNSEAIIRAGESKRVFTHLEASNLIQGIDNESATQRKKIQKEINDYVKKLEDEQYKQSKGLLDQSVLDFRDAQNQRLLEIESSLAKESEALADRYSQGLITAKEYQTSLYQLEQGATENRIKVQLDAVEKIIEAQSAAIALGFGNGKDLQKSTDEFTRLQIQASNLRANTELSNIRKVEEARKALRDQEKQIVDSSIELIKTLVEAGYQRQIDALNEQSELVTKNADVEKETVDRSLATSQEKEDKKRLIDAKAQARQDQLAKQQKKIAHDQAVFEKIINLAKTAEAIALAEVQALTYLSNPLTAPLYPAIAATIGAVGALNLATILAQPIPAYKDGTNYAPGGWSIFGEAGTEYIKEPGKAGYFTQGATLANIPTGTEIISNKDLMNAMANPRSGRNIENQLNLSQLLQQNESHTRRLEKALQVKQANNYRVGVRDGKRFSEYLKRNIN